MLLLGGKQGLNYANHARRYAAPSNSNGNRLQEGGYLSVPTSHKSSPLAFPNTARLRSRINRGRGRPEKNGRGVRGGKAATSPGASGLDAYPWLTLS